MADKRPQPTPDELAEELRRQELAYRKLERAHQALQRSARLTEEIAENSKSVLMRAQQMLVEEVEERKATERELEKLIEEFDVARQSRETFLSILTQQLDAPVKGALEMLKIIASRPLDRTQKDLLELAMTSVRTVETLLRSAEAISNHHRGDSLGDETLRQLMGATQDKD